MTTGRANPTTKITPARNRRLAERITDDLFSIDDFHGEQMWMENKEHTQMMMGRSRFQMACVIYCYLRRAEARRSL